MIVYNVCMDVLRVPTMDITDPNEDFRVARQESLESGIIIYGCLPATNDSDAVKKFRAKWDNSYFRKLNGYVVIHEYYLEKYESDFLGELEESDIPDGTRYESFRYNREKAEWEVSA